VFIIVTVHAQVFPVRAVRGIVPVITVFMVYSQQVPVFVVELFAALGAYESVNLKRAFPVVGGRRIALPQFPDNLVSGFVFAFFLWPSQFLPAPVFTAHTKYLVILKFSQLKASMGSVRDIRQIQNFIGYKMFNIEY
jgi:hypothetical protein